MLLRTGRKVWAGCSVLGPIYFKKQLERVRERREQGELNKPAGAESSEWGGAAQNQS